ncbi:hypothetical protein DAERI_100018 [Deinococcus aerius]|uniref:SpoVT-AbrB domain-containing protein n=1 Tax=Deinococcus aerius TaxID=200253 RepID=A0A2I9DZY3_9DEIO|nr:hypothetical protein [Deinococcus aerius]GBF06655.1 hypothetical protein DAERI_100018 [Deinococcus aerius]
MTMTATEVLLTIGEDGALKLPQEALNALGTRQVKLSLQDGQITVKPRPKYLHEIEDVQERMEAFDRFIESFAKETNVSWPEDYNVRDDIYD